VITTSARNGAAFYQWIIAGLIVITGMLITASNRITISNIRRAGPTATARADFSWWKPGPKNRLQIQFAGLPVVMQKDVEIYDLDLFDTEKDTVVAIHAAGAHVLCYINAGAWEDWRPDADQYPKEIVGQVYEGWPGEKWLDIRRMDDLKSILSARFDLCKEKGFDGVEPDNLDGYQNETGFGLTADDQLAFNRWLALMAHSRGLSIGLKNDPDQMEVLVKDFDFTVMEDCLVSGWCENALPFIKDVKPAYAVEYTDRTSSLTPFCDQAHGLGVQTFLKHRELDAWRSSCD
jgi:hypothetical protein